MKETVQVISKDNSYVAVDLETTGLNPAADRIIEIGAVRVADGIAVEEFSALISPGKKLSGQITALTGITEELLRGAEGIEKVLGPAVDFLDDLPLLGHHIIFDYSFLKQAVIAQRPGPEGGPDRRSFEKEGIDTLTLCRRFMPQEAKKNLAAAARYFGIREAPSHRALADAWTAHLLYQEIRKRFFTEFADEFKGKQLKYKAKKQQPATKRQKEVLQDLIKCHKIGISVGIDGLTKSEASRLTDQIIFRYGRIKR